MYKCISKQCDDTKNIIASIRERFIH